MSRLRGLAAFAAIGAACAPSAVALAAHSPWAKRADAVCASWQKKAASVLGANPKQPSTVKGMYGFMVKARPLEAGELHALQGITASRPPGAAKALALASADLHEIDVAIAAYRAGRKPLFLRDVDVWQSDRRADRAFIAVGASVCG